MLPRKRLHDHHIPIRERYARNLGVIQEARTRLVSLPRRTASFAMLLVATLPAWRSRRWATRFARRCSRAPQP